MMSDDPQATELTPNDVAELLTPPGGQPFTSNAFGLFQAMTASPLPDLTELTETP